MSNSPRVRLVICFAAVAAVTALVFAAGSKAGVRPAIKPARRIATPVRVLDQPLVFRLTDDDSYVLVVSLSASPYASDVHPIIGASRLGEYAFGRLTLGFAGTLPSSQTGPGPAVCVASDWSHDPYFGDALDRVDRLRAGSTVGVRVRPYQRQPGGYHVLGPTSRFRVPLREAGKFSDKAVVAALTRLGCRR